MKKKGQELERIEAALAELRTLFPENRLHRTHPPLTASQVEAVETQLGFALPNGFRAYLQRIGDGGAGLHLYLHTGVARVASLEGEALAQAKRPFRAKQPTWDGTFALGVPTGTHEYYVLVLRGAHADEVWIDSSNEDGGTFGPHRPAKFLEAQARYFEDLIAEHHAKQAARRKAATGDVAGLIAKQKTRNKRREMLETLSGTANRTIRSPDASAADCLGAVGTLDAVADAYAKENTSTYWTNRWLLLALLRAGQYERARVLAQQQYEESCATDLDPRDMVRAFSPAAALHLLVASVGRGEPAVDLPLPAPEAYGKAAHQWDADVLGPIFDRLPPAARTIAGVRLGVAWQRWFESSG